MVRGKEKLSSLEGDLAEGHVPWEIIMGDIMGDRERVTDDAQLPDTGIPAHYERILSSIFVEPAEMPVPLNSFLQQCSHSLRGPVWGED